MKVAMSITLLNICLAWLAVSVSGCGASRSPTLQAHKNENIDAEVSTTSTAPPKPVPFVDRATSFAIEWTYRNGEEAQFSTILESLGGGVGWLDYDGDGWLDLIATGGGKFGDGQTIHGRSGQLFRNHKGKSFVPVGSNARIESDRLYSHGVTIGDFDNDGFQDVLITGYGTPQLFQNMGDGSFIETAASAGITDSKWSSSAGWADFNRDGNLDLYIAHYVNWSFGNHPFCQGTQEGDREICPPRSFEPLPDTLYLSRGDGTFDDVSQQVGLRSDGKGLGVLLADVEPDGDIDIYVANDTTDNFLYLNDGAGRFQENALLAGVAVDENGIPNGSMGVDLCDFNADGRPDIWVANYERESFALYRNEGNGSFLHMSQRLGITDLGGLFVGFGTACEDFDADGDQDIVVANGHVIKYPSASPRRQLPLYLEFDGSRYRRSSYDPSEYLGRPHEGRGLATADFDEDGDLDLAISHLNAPLALLENVIHAENRSLAVRLIGITANRDAVGARVQLTTAKRAFHRQIIGGGSYLSQSARTLKFSFSSNDHPLTLTIHWPGGAVQTHDISSRSGLLTYFEPLSP